ncbi:MAG: type II toxin-antitoxin system HicB family antitoxin [Cardiobacteriaceae bacterium]|nr:type II toxin-antitoxin system HicB family antitoxin [Cardiobacteriaceae bacterium]
MYYFAKMEKDTDGITVSFRDIPEAITCGQTLEEAKFMAEDALLTAIEFYFEDNKFIPSPSQPHEGEIAVYFPDGAYSKVLLHNALLEKNISEVQLANAIGASSFEIQGILDVRQLTKIDVVGKALNAIGKNLCMSVE